MTGRNPKKASLDQKYYESDEIVSCFEPLHALLLSELQPQRRDLGGFEARELSIFLGQLQQFQQDNLGVFNKANHAPLRIPAKLFKMDHRSLHNTNKITKKKQQQQHTSLNEHHPIYTMLLAAYTFRLKHNWRKWEWHNPAKKAKNVELIQVIREALIKQGFIQPPRIAFSGSVTESAKKSLKTLVRKIGANVVDRQDSPSHILHGALHEYNGMEEDWFRTLEKQDNKVLVHWWYYPDSYDSWLTQTEQFADPEEPPVHTGAWHLTCRWLQDTVKFNEMMNEEDYEDVDTDSVVEDVEGEEEEEIDEEIEEEDDEEEEEEEDEVDNDDYDTTTPTDTSTAQVNVSSTSTNTVRRSPKRKACEVFMDTSSTYDDEGTHDNNGERTFIQSTELPILDSSAQPVVLIRDVDIERPTPGSRQRKNEFEPYMNGDISNISQYTSQHIQFPNTSATMVPNGKLEKDKEGMTDGDDLYSLCNTQPQCYSNLYTPTWFDMDKVNEMEKLALPEFFDAHEKEYIQYRNYMVEQYRSNPSYFVTISACKKAFPNADTVSLVRLHSFLELYKVINVQNDPRLHLYDPTIDSEPDAYPEFNLHRHLEPVKKVDIHYLRKLIYDSVKSRKTSSTWNVMAEEANNLDGRKIYRCKNCLADCSAIRYQCIKRLDLHLCIDCFVHGRFTAVYASSDFVRMDETNDSNIGSNSNNNNNGNNLIGSSMISSEQDVDEDWTDEEILLLLEGMDQYDDDWLMVSEHVGSRSKEQCITQFLQMPITDDFLTSKLSSKEQDQLPFANTANPVMTMIAYLAAHVNPGVGSAAAKAAMKELLQASATLQEKQQNNTDQQHGDENQTMDVDIDVDEDDDDMDEDSDTTSTPFSKKVLLSATSAALEAAAIQARKLSSYEDQEIQHWTRLAVKTVVDKLALKIQQYEDFDQVLENDLQEMSSQSAVLQTTLENLRKQHYPLPSSDSDPSIPTTTSLDASSSVK